MRSRHRSRLRVDAAIGGMAGLASGLLGVGGGFLIVPLLTVWAGMDQHRATGTSLAAILPISVVAAGIYYFGGGTPQADLAIAAALVAGSVVGVIGGTFAAQRMSETALRMFVAILLLVVGVKDLHDLVFGAAAGNGGHAAGLAWEQYVLIAVCGLGIGIVAGLAGLGGGVFIVPLLVIGFGISQRVAQGTSLIAILPAAAIGAIIHEANGEVDVRAATVIAAAGVPAAIAGALLALLVPQRILLGLFGVFLIFAAVRTWPRWPAIRRA
ncbi:MAG TPA: sulfite exporter TauE/SafE family protein [Candidatus Dormibacteraeota bacterium]|nr:sulfite exporter TauE/SafE family protein [Candidatus Dormibacteraeota bacterium]